MFSLFHKIAVILFLSFSFAVANAETPPEENGAAKPTEGESEGAKAPPKPKKTKQSLEDSYISVLMRVQSLEAQVRSGEEEIKKLIEEKEQTKDPEKLKEILREIKRVHLELQKDAKDFNQQRSLLMYRYPEKGREEKRTYERIEVKPVDEMESAISLSNTVNKTLRKVRTQYKKPEESGGVSEEPIKSTKGERPADALTKPVVIKK